MTRFLAFAALLLSLAVGCTHSPRQKKAPPQQPQQAQRNGSAMSPDEQALEELRLCALYCPDASRLAAADLYAGWSRLLALEKMEATNPGSQQLKEEEASRAFLLISRGMLRYLRWAPDAETKAEVAQDVLEFSKAVRPGDPAVAEKILTEVDATADLLMQINPQSADVHLLQGLVLDERGATEKEVRDAYTRCLDLEPGHSDCQRLVSQLERE